MKQISQSFSQYLLDKGHIDTSLKSALETEANKRKQPFEDILRTSGVLDEQQIFHALVAYADVPAASKNSYSLQALKNFNNKTIIHINSTHIDAFTITPPSLQEVAQVQTAFPTQKISFFLMPPTKFITLQKKISFYGDKRMQDTHNTKIDASMRLTQLIDQAILNKASDIHFHPKQQIVTIKLRVDGQLRTINYIHKDLWNQLLIHIKVKGDLNIAETKKPQSGAFYHMYGITPVPIRLSTHPSFYGETLTLRILDINHAIHTIGDLSMPDTVITALKQTLCSEKGLFLVVGPTGSGKTTTLYALLDFLNQTQKHIITLEQPIEKHIQSFTQTEISEEGPLSFDAGVRSALRQDPDILLVGETRDEKTASAVFRASMTGHQTFTTLHAGTPEEALDRLKDLGISSQLQKTQISGILAQRLVPQLCKACKIKHKKQSNHNTKGCPTCHYTGYTGCILMTELLCRTSGNTPLEKIAPSFKVQATQHLESGCVALKDVQSLLGKTI